MKRGASNFTRRSQSHVVSYPYDVARGVSSASRLVSGAPSVDFTFVANPEPSSHTSDTALAAMSRSSRGGPSRTAAASARTAEAAAARRFDPASSSADVVPLTLVFLGCEDLEVKTLVHEVWRLNSAGDRTVRVAALVALPSSLSTSGASPQGPQGQGGFQHVQTTRSIAPHTYLGPATSEDFGEESFTPKDAARYALKPYLRGALNLLGHEQAEGSEGRPLADILGCSANAGQGLGAHAHIVRDVARRPIGCYSAS